MSETTLAAAATVAITHTAGASTLSSTSASITYHCAQVEGVGIFYREAGPKDAPAVVLLHGYPSSSRMYDTLIPLLADPVGPVLRDPGPFGPKSFFVCIGVLDDDGLHTLRMRQRDAKADGPAIILHKEDVAIDPELLKQSVGRLGEMIEGIAVARGDWRFALPEAGVVWGDRVETAGHPEQLDAFVSLESARQRHLGNTPNPERYNPDTWTDEYAILSRSGEREIQGELLYDYQFNVASYPRWQAWLRQHRPPTLILWGRYDPSFIVPGALAYQRDVPTAELHILDAGHFALDEQTDTVAQVTRDFLLRVLG
jgi:pimeloyl-ACP methyl ester carboxylesterase